MPNPLIEFSQAILKLNKEKKFSDALKHFKENKTQFTAEQIASNEYLISAMITALRQTGNFDNAFRFLELYNITLLSGRFFIKVLKRSSLILFSDFNYLTI